LEYQEANAMSSRTDGCFQSAARACITLPACWP
jgi:hypothetical protein